MNLYFSPLWAMKFRHGLSETNQHHEPFHQYRCGSGLELPSPHYSEGFVYKKLIVSGLLLLLACPSAGVYALKKKYCSLVNKDNLPGRRFMITFDYWTNDDFLVRLLDVCVRKFQERNSIVSSQVVLSLISL